MSVLIHMEMPESCYYCPFMDGSWGYSPQHKARCIITGKEMPVDDRGVQHNSCCPLVEVPDNRWIPIESRPMDDEERQYYSEYYGNKLTDEEAVIYCSQLPEHGQEVLVCSMYGHIWKDTFDDDPDYGVGFEENGDMDGIVAWMPLPEPYKAEEAGE